MASRTYNANPFFSSAFFAPSVGEKIDNATAQAQAKAEELKVKGEKMAGVYGDKAYNKLQDAKEIVKDTASVNPTGVDLYARFVERARGGRASGMSPEGRC
jgi:solute carrier family 25 phosphate transporter 3